jgi:uncharacterized protein
MRPSQLEDPAIYPEAPQDVEIVETHLSIVCLAGGTVFKLKKPIVLPFADYSTLELRKHYCEEELRLNRRLCPTIYLGVSELHQSSPGLGLRWDADEGVVIDYAVRMRRLPSERMLDVLLESNAVSDDEIRLLARCVAEFHRTAERSSQVARAGAPAHLRQFALDNYREIRQASSRCFPEDFLAHLEERTRADFEWLVPRLVARGPAHIVDGHGDLHARNVCLTAPPAIYDCLEFSPDMRCSDTATENAFLVMDLTYRGHPRLARVYLEEYESITGDRDQHTLMGPLLRYRAMVRAKVSGIIAVDENQSPEQRARALSSARRHVHLALASSLSASPWLIVASGLPGTGKSTILSALSRQTGWPLLATDAVRKELQGALPSQKLPDEAYTEQSKDQTYAETLRRAELQLSSTSVVVDAGFRTKADRRRAFDLARKCGAGLLVVSVSASEEDARRWLTARAASDTAVSDATFAVHLKLREELEPPEAAEGFSLLALTSPLGDDDSVESILRALLASSEHLV